MSSSTFVSGFTVRTDVFTAAARGFAASRAFSSPSALTRPVKRLSLSTTNPMT